VALVEKILCSKGFNQHAKRFFGILTGSEQLGLVWELRFFYCVLILCFLRGNSWGPTRYHLIS